MKIARAGASFVVSVALAAPGGGASARGDAPPAEAGTAPDRAALRRELRELTAPAPYFDILATAMVGGGLRFNNPYRLAHVLGQSAESLSSTAPYLELALGATTGRPTGLQHGARLGFSIALEGVPQQVLTPAYQAVLRLPPSFLLYGWAGVPIILNPDANVGAELAVGAAWLARAGLGVVLAAVADGFYGAGTRETTAALYPVLSAQVGLLVGYEVLP
jgi:hypothetical protein